jgi:hypothetical protein
MSRMPVGALFAAGLAAAWLIVDPRTPDLAAQAYRVGLYEQVGFAVFDEHWYAGHGLPGYSLLFAPLASLLGMRVLAAIAAIASAALFERIALRAYGEHRSVRLGAACLFAVAAVGDVWSGRLTFALGVTFALACVHALLHRRALLAALAAAACAAASPVAGLLLALAGCTYVLACRAWPRESMPPTALQPSRVLLALVAPVALVLTPLELLFAEGGYEPYPAKSFAVTVVVGLAFLWALPRGSDRRLRVLRLGAVVYLLVCLLCLAIHTPMGSNVERYGVLLAGPLLLCALADRGGGGVGGASGTARAGRRPRYVPVGVALCVIVAWVAWGPVRETLAVSGAGGEVTQAAYYAPVKRFFASLGGGGALGAEPPVRVEVPLTRSHWEAALLAPSVSLARGWEKQLEERYDSALLARELTSAGYYRWLRAQAVGYVALPDAPPDPSSAQESALIRRGLPYLRLVFASRHWRVYAVRAPTPLLAGPGRLTALGHDSFALFARARGALLVRVHFTHWLTLSSGSGCVTSAPGGWTYVYADAPGPIVVSARFSLSRALGLGGSCPGR